MLDEEANDNVDSRVEEGEGEEGAGAVVVDVGRKGEDGAADSGRWVLVCRTDEQFEMARGCAEDTEFW